MPPRNGASPAKERAAPRHPVSPDDNYLLKTVRDPRCRRTDPAWRQARGTFPNPYLLSLQAIDTSVIAPIYSCPQSRR